MQHHLFTGRTSRVRTWGAIVVAFGAVGAIVSLHAQDDLNFLVTFADATGVPLADIRAEEVVITENGVNGTVLGLESASRPLDVTLLIDNGIGMGTALGEIRTGVKAFFAGLPEGSQMSLVTIAPQPRFVQRPTTDRTAVLRSADRITPDDGLGRFLDALVEAGDRMGKQSETRFPVIVAIGSNAPDGSTSLEQHYKKLAGRISDYHATVHSAILSTNARVTNDRIPQGVSSALQHVVARGLSDISGGRYEPIAASSRLATLLPEIAAQIRSESHRYWLRARRPAGAKGQVGSVSFGIARPGVSMRARYTTPPK